MDVGWYKELNTMQVGLGKVVLMLVAAFVVGRFVYHELHATFIDTVEAEAFQTVTAAKLDDIEDTINASKTNAGKMQNAVVKYKIDIARNGDEEAILETEIIRLEARIEEEEDIVAAKLILRQCIIAEQEYCEF